MLTRLLSSSGLPVTQFCPSSFFVVVRNGKLNGARISILFSTVSVSRDQLRQGSDYAGEDEGSREALVLAGNYPVNSQPRDVFPISNLKNKSGEKKAIKMWL